MVYRVSRVSQIAGCGALLLTVLALGGCDDGARLVSGPVASKQPAVDAVVPADRDNRIALDAAVSVRFSADILATSVDDSSFTLHTAAGPVAANVVFDGQIALLDPTAPLLPSTEYTATLHPAISDLDGEAIEVYRWSFYTDGSGWDVAQPLESDDTGNAVGAQVGVSGAGDAVAVWRQTDGSQYNVMGNTYTAASGWGTPTLLENNTDGNATDVAVSVNPSGHAVVVWRQSEAVGTATWSNRYDPGSGWGTAEAIDTGAGPSHEPRVGMDAEGRAIAVWRRSAGLVSDIWSNRYEPGVGWGTAEPIEFDSVTSAQDPQLAVNESGHATVAWRHGTEVLANHYTPGVGWDTPVRVSDDSADAYSPGVSVDHVGNAMVVWLEGDAAHLDAFARRYERGTGWLASAEVETSTSASVQNPAVLLANDGSAIAVWSQDDGVRHNVYANRYTGAAWGAPELIESNDAGYALDPRLTRAGDTGAVAVWREYDGSRYNIAANWFAPATGWADATAVEDHDAGSALGAQIGANADGDAFAIWHEYDGARYNIGAARFNYRVVEP